LDCGHGVSLAFRWKSTSGVGPDFASLTFDALEVEAK
jgi:hypothetical protein